MPIQPDQIINNRYRIDTFLGQGGMATVYKAYDTRLDRVVAIKIIRRDVFPPIHLDSILKRFDREAKAMASLAHANIVNVYDYGEIQGAPYLVLEYHLGGTLQDQLSGPIDWHQAVELVKPLTRALGYAHQRGFVHRDIKPSNILISENGEPVLSDFGITKILTNEEVQTLTGTGVGIGTPEYMSPEQGRGRDVDRRSDVYSLGILLYQMVTGRRPYEADTPMEILLKHINDPIPMPTDVNPDLPPELEAILLTAMSKKPEDRFQDMAAFGGALDKITQDIPPSPPTPLPEEPDLTRDNLIINHTDTLQIPDAPARQTRPRNIPLWGWFVASTAVIIFIAVIILRGSLAGPIPIVAVPSPTQTEALPATLTPIPELVKAPSETLVVGTEIEASPTTTKTPSPSPSPTATSTTTPSPTQTPTTGDISCIGIDISGFWTGTETYNNHVYSIELKINQKNCAVSGTLVSDHWPGESNSWNFKDDNIEDGWVSVYYSYSVVNLKINDEKTMSAIDGYSVYYLQKIPTTPTPIPENAVSVPNVVGLERDSAKSKIIDTGFTFLEIFVQDPDIGLGLVAEQNPLPGTLLSLGEPIKIIVSADFILISENSRDSRHEECRDYPVTLEKDENYYFKLSNTRSAAWYITWGIWFSGGGQSFGERLINESAYHANYTSPYTGSAQIRICTYENSGWLENSSVYTLQMYSINVTP